MCGDCFEENIYRFSSVQEYIRLETAIWNRLQQGKLIEMNVDTAASVYQPDTSYQCQACNEVWFLSVPDNAWRGYLLSQDSAAVYIGKIRRNDRIKAAIGIGCLLTFGAAILWSIFR